MLLTLTSTLYFRRYVLVVTSKRIMVSIRNRRILHPLTGLSPNVLAVDSLDPGHETIRSSTHARRCPNSITGLHPAGMRNPVRCCGGGFGCYRSLFPSVRSESLHSHSLERPYPSLLIRRSPQPTQRSCPRSNIRPRTNCKQIP